MNEQNYHPYKQKKILEFLFPKTKKNPDAKKIK